MNRNSRRARQKGSAMLETALVLLTVLSMIIFIMDMGRILLLQQFITARATATVRAAAVNNWTQTDVQNYLVYNSTSAPQNNGGAGQPAPQEGGGYGFLGLQPSQVSFTTLGTAGTPDYRLQVQVSGVPAITWIPFMAGKFI